MNAIISLFQNVYFAWLVAVAALSFAIVKQNRIKNRIATIEEEHRNQIKNVEDKASVQIQKMTAQTNELVRQTKDQCNADIQHERLLFNEKIRLLQEQIESDKASIMKKTEKEILADLTVSLNGFAKRIDRVENNLTSINHEMELIVDKADKIGVTVSDIQFQL